jgi:hypothetical protein
MLPRSPLRFAASGAAALTVMIAAAVPAQASPTVERVTAHSPVGEIDFGREPEKAIAGFS